MKITALRLFNVKRFAGRGVAMEAIGDGVNVLCAPNEHGKSTSFEALHALFFQPHTGVPKDVRRLQPYAGGNPLVEADIEVPEGRYRLTKQFIGGKRASVVDLDSGRVVAQADEAERFVAGLVGGDTAGPSGLLWVRQGVTGLGEGSKSEVDEEARVRQSLLTSVQGEVEAITGGRRMAEILEQCSAELAVLVTPTMRPKAGGPYDEVLKERQRLEAEEQRLRGEVETLREALDRRAEKQKRLDVLQNAEDEAGRRAALVAAEAAWQQARVHAEKLKAAEAELALARGQRDIAARAAEGFATALDGAARVTAELASARTLRDGALNEREKARAALEAARAAAIAAEDEEREAQALLARLDAALAARKAAEDMAGLEARLAEAEALRGALEAAEAELALLAISPKGIVALEKLELDLARLRAAEEALMPSVTITYAPGATEKALLDGRAVDEGVEQPIGGLSRLELPGLGQLTLRSNRPADAGRALQAAEEEHRSVLGRLGVSSLAEARQRQLAGNAKAAEIERLKLTLAHAAPDGVQRLREMVTEKSRIDAGALELKGDPIAARAALEAARLKVGETRGALSAAQPGLARIGDTLVDAETRHAGLQSELARLQDVLGPEADRQARTEALAAALAAAEAELRMREAEVANLRAAAPDIENAEAALRRAKSVVEAAVQETAQLRETLASLRATIASRAEDAVEEAWREAQELLAAATSRVQRFEAEVATLGRLKQALEEARSEARDLYLKPVIAELKPLLGLLFDDVSITFDDKSLLPQTISRDGLEEDIERLSGGMREQLSILTRLAFARLLARGGRAAPVVLDDALVYSDDDRIERMFDALHRQARDQQIIVFSCRQRAFSQLGGNVLTMTEWRPEGV